MAILGFVSDRFVVDIYSKYDSFGCFGQAISTNPKSNLWKYYPLDKKKRKIL
jgi:hypothetical protein